MVGTTMTQTTRQPANGKTVLTTGEVARICHVAPRTVTKWFDTGKLRGYRIPGSRDRRIPMDELVAFMKAHDMPMDELDGAARRVLIFDAEPPAGVDSKLGDSENYEVHLVASGFDAGVAAARVAPHVIVVAVSNGFNACHAARLCESIRGHESLRSAKVFAVVTNLTPRKQQKLLSHGFDRCLPAPYAASDLAEAIEDAMDLVT